MICDSLTNIFRENTFIKNTSSKNSTKYILRVCLVIILRSNSSICNI